MIKSISFSFNSTEEISSILEMNLLNIDFNPTLAFCFISVDLPLEIIMEAFDRRKIKIFGASSCGELLFNDDQQVISDKAGVITITNIPTDNFQIISKNRGDLDSKQFGKLLGDEINKCNFQSSAILAASGLTIDGQAIVEGIIENNNENLTMFGGLAGDDSKFEETYVFTEKEILTDGSLMLLLDKKKIKVSGIASSGWIGLGADLKITK